LTLRAKLSLIGLVLLVLPWAAWRLIGTTERLLRQAEEQALLASTATLARSFAADASMPVTGAAPALYARAMPRPVRLDGYAEDWQDWPDGFLAFPRDAGPASWLQVALAADANAYYLLFRVRDPELVYRDRPLPATAAADRIRLRLRDGERERSLIVDTIAPGWVQARYRDGATEQRVAGAWQESGDGYVVELRVPRGLAAAGIGFAVADVGAGDNTRWAGTGGGAEPVVRAVLEPSPGADRRLGALAPEQGRAWLVSPQGWVLGRAGGPAAAPESDISLWLRNLIYRRILASPLQDPAERGPACLRLGGTEVEGALAGEAATAWRSAADTSDVVVSAAQPIVGVDGKTLGAVVVERPSDGVLLLTNRGMVELVGTTMLAVTLALGVLVVFAGRLSGRIRRLRDAAAGAVDSKGRVSPEMPGQQRTDELGDLSRSFRSTLESLQAYTRYLRNLAGKLSHELRTPLAMVNSSLQHLDAGPLDDESRRYAERARDGAQRLDRILRGMSEATRIEQALGSEEFERVELDALARGIVESYRDLHPEREFQLEIGEADYKVAGSPEWLGQMLGKLLDNALDFAAPGTPIRVTLDRAEDRFRLAVANQGPPLPANMAGQLFDFLVSVRESGQRRAEQPHLGLGLYLVRLVAEMHGGSVGTENLTGGSGVRFTVVLPDRG